MHCRCLHKYRNGYSTMLALLPAAVLRPKVGHSSMVSDFPRSGGQINFASTVMIA
jgi:hypothetical protein